MKDFSRRRTVLYRSYTEKKYYWSQFS